jgi:hypothetical protein
MASFTAPSNGETKGGETKSGETKSGETKSGETKSDAKKWKYDTNGLPIADVVRIPDEYCCPISLEVMRDPVIASDGHTYERVSIQDWFDRGNRTSPRTGLGLKNIEVTENINLRKLIQDWEKREESSSVEYVPTQDHIPPASLTLLSHYFRGLDIIRSELEEALDGWKPPVVVVFGQQSCGKSTLLERIAMVPLFPKGPNICTRLPIKVELRNGPRCNPTLCIMEKQANQADTETVVPCDFSTAQDHSADIQNIMLAAIRREHQKITGISSKTYLKLLLTGPLLPNLDLMDVPGLVLNPSEG